MILVVDASFAAKVMLTEKHSDFARQWWLEESATWWAPALVGAEVASAITVHHSNHPESADIVRRRAASVQWATMLDGIAQRSVTRELSDMAIRVIQNHGPVRGADACYIALALTLAEDSGADVVLGSFDKQQRKAAASAGLAVTPT